MKVFRKRAVALLIDSFLLGALLVLTQELLNWGDWDILLIILFFFKDCVFKNASIGKKLMGLSIYNSDWKAPSIKVLFKRGALMLTVGYLLTWKALAVGESLISVFDFERERLGTQVIDKRVYSELAQQAKQRDGDFSKNMTELYNSYLRDLYIKQ